MKRIFFMAAMLLALASCDSQRNGTETPETTADAPQAVTQDLAYVQVEAVLSQSELYLTEGVALKEKTEKAQQSWARKEQNFSYEMAQLQEKYQKGLITTANAQSTEQDIQRRVAAYQTQAQKEAQTLDEENFVFSNRAQDLLRRAVRNLNTDGRYKMIVNANALIEADTTLDITPAVLQEVNRLYALEKKEK